MKLIRTLKTHSIILIGIIVMMLSSGNSLGAVISLNPTDDTFIDEIGPNNIHGAENWLVVRRGGTGYKLQVLAKFDLNSIPPNTVIVSATLKLYHTHWADGDPAGRILPAYCLSEDWDEATATWNNQPGTVPAIRATETVPSATGVWLQWDLTESVQEMVDGSSPNYGWKITDPSTGGAFPMIYFQSKEFGSNAPVLEIETAEIEYWKPPYRNYAPHTPGGMPDFDAKQNGWKTIYPGPDGVINSTAVGDDVFNIAYNVIAPGQDCNLDSDPTGDDYADWSFSGPVALANCFFWFDSKFADSTGYPGDGVDQFPLVEGYYVDAKAVDQEQPLVTSFIDVPDTRPGHVQSFIPDQSVLDAVQIMLKFAYPGTPAVIEVSIYDALPNSPGVLALGSSIQIMSGPFTEVWYQFHFYPSITLTPGATYYLAVRIQGGDVGNAQWCYSDENPYPFGMAYFNFSNYALEPYPNTDFTFRTEYYASGTLDDHEADNVPYLIEDLADRMFVCDSGVTHVQYMQDAIDEWLIEKGLDGSFVESTYVAPTFEFIEAEIERSQDVILLLGFYNWKLIDQQQTLWFNGTDLYTWPPGHLQDFIPSVDVLDAVEVLLMADSLTPTTVEVTIYDAFPNNTSVLPIGRSVKVVSVPWYPTWYQFHFDPPVAISPGSQYFIAVRTLDVTSNVEWCYIDANVYANGERWENWDDYYLESEPFQDWAFKTEYYEDQDCYRRNQQYVTCAGVNSDQQIIAFSDPNRDVQNISVDDHNDAQYVSHDIYRVEMGMPCPQLSYEWYLPDFPSAYEFTVVEAAVIICPTSDILCGDANSDGTLNVGDAVYLINYVFKNGPAPVPLCKGDANNDGAVNVGDAVYMINFVFKNGPAPGPNCCP